MSFQAMTWATEQKLPAKEKLVLLMLANCHNHHSNRCDPSHNRLADECGLSLSSVKRAISELEKKKLLTIKNRKVGDVNLPNSYSFNFGVVGSHRTEVSPYGTEGSVQGELQTRNINQEYNNTIVDDVTIDQPDQEITEEQITPPVKPRKKIIQNIPYQKIVDIYNAVTVGCFKGCLKLDKKRKSNIQKCWNLNFNGQLPFQNLSFWEGYFNDCLENKFWQGENDRNWKADIEFLTRTDKVLQVLEGE